MEATGEVLNGAQMAVATAETNVTAQPKGAAISSEVAGVNAQAKALQINATTAILSVAVAATLMVGISSEVEIIDPNDFVNSCYGGGYWDNEQPYVNNDAWYNT